MTETVQNVDTPPSTDKPDNIALVTTAADFPTVYSDGCWFASLMSGTVRLTFLENILEPQNSMTPGLKARHVGTLVMPREAFDGMLKYLNGLQPAWQALEQPDAE
jgi:hypothetical protein